MAQSGRDRNGKSAIADSYSAVDYSVTNQNVLVDCEERVQSVQPAKYIVKFSRRNKPEERNSLQIVTDRRTRRDLRRHRGRPVFVCLAEPRGIDKPERLCVIEQRVKHGHGVEHGGGVDVAMFSLETERGGAQLGIIVGEVGLDGCDGGLALFDDQRRAVGRGDR